ncbi:MAG: alpha/beta hydrolase, partial [Terriglobales bacterium]
MFTPPQRHRCRAIVIFVVLLGVAVLLALACPAWTHFRAAAILLRVQAPQHPGKLAKLAAHPIEEVPTEVPTPSGSIRARLYVPKDNGNAQLNAPGLVLVHGVHRLGIDEPRLVAFARALSASDIRVLTPELL